MTPAVITLYRDLPDKDVDELLSLLDDAEIDAEIGPPHVRMGTLAEATTQMLLQISLENLSAVMITAAGMRLWKGLRTLFDRDDEESQNEALIVIIDPQTGHRIELTHSALHHSSLSELLDLINEQHPREPPPLIATWDETSSTWHIH
ncbi:hypothetical protein [Actinomadura sp. 9N215]|uniref:hypothetical protein n=1 Tax=Actinomadura sp. 9N215 TaxID=3375150 RepID=UPI0037922DAD